MKARTKGFIVGFLSTAAIISSVVCTVATGTGGLTFNTFNLIYNGETISSKGENYALDSGASVPSSIVYTDLNGGGTTYLPISRISNLLEQPIGWDGSTGSVLIGEYSPVVIPDTPIRIFKTELTDIDSVGGVSFRIFWNNHSTKDIKYIHFYVTPYNRVGDPVKCEISKNSTQGCYDTGPFKHVTESTDFSDGFYYIPTKYLSDSPGFQSYTLVSNPGKYSYGRINEYKTLTSVDYDNILFWSSWSRVWYNSSIDHVKVNKVLIEYMDGSTITLSGDTLSECIY